MQPLKLTVGKTKKYTTQNYPEYDKDFNDLLAGFPFAQSKENFKR
jgi:protease-4